MEVFGQFIGIFPFVRIFLDEKQGLHRRHAVQRANYSIEGLRVVEKEFNIVEKLFEGMVFVLVKFLLNMREINGIFDSREVISMRPRIEASRDGGSWRKSETTFCWVIEQSVQRAFCHLRTCRTVEHRRIPDRHPPRREEC